MLILTIILSMSSLTLAQVWLNPNKPYICCYPSDNGCPLATNLQTCSTINPSQAYSITTYDGDLYSGGKDGEPGDSEDCWVVNPALKEITSLDPIYGNSMFANITSVDCLPSGCDYDFPEGLPVANYTGYSEDCDCTLFNLTETYSYLGKNGADCVATNLQTIPIHHYLLNVTIMSKYGPGDSSFYNDLYPIRRTGLEAVDPITTECQANYKVLWPHFSNITVYLDEAPEFTWVVMIRKDEFTYNYECEGPLCYLALPPDMFMSYGNIYLDIMFIPQLCRAFVIPVYGEEQCMPHDCTLTCPRLAFKYYHCMPHSIQVGIIVSMVCIGVIFLAAIGLIWWLVRYSFGCAVGAPIMIIAGGKAFLASPIVVGGAKRAVWGWKVMITSLGVKDQEVLKHWEEQEKLKKTNDSSSEKGMSTSTELSKMVNRPGGFAALALLMMLSVVVPVGAEVIVVPNEGVISVPGDVGCSLTAYSTAQIQNCVVDTTQKTETCWVTFSGTTDLRVGETSCISLRDENDRFIATVYMHYAGMTAKVDLASKYYTSDWDISTKTYDQCDGGNCKISNCNYFDGKSALCSGDKNSDGTTFPFNSKWCNDEDKKWPGINYCYARDPKGFDCAGGFETDKSCEWQIVQIKPKGEIYEVFSPNKVYYNPILNTVISTGDENHMQIFNNVLFETGTASFADGVTVEMVGAYFTDPIMFSGKSFAKSLLTNKWLAVTASEVLSPEPLKMGDIQSQTAIGLKIPKRNPKSFIWNQNMFNCRQSGDFKKCDYQTTGTRTQTDKTVVAKNALPNQFSGEYWYYDDNMKTIVSNLTKPGALKVSVFAEGQGIQLTMRTTKVCPNIVALNGTGCYNCESGATIQVIATSDCSSGHVTLSVDDPSVILHTTDMILFAGQQEIWSLRVSVSHAENSFKIKMIDDTGKFSDEMEVSFIAIRYTYNDTLFGDNIIGTNQHADDKTGFNVKGLSGGNLFGQFGNIPQPIQLLLTYIMYALMAFVVYVVSMKLWEASKDVGKRDNHGWYNIMNRFNSEKKSV